MVFRNNRGIQRLAPAEGPRWGQGGLASRHGSYYITGLDHYDSTAWVTFDSLWISLLTIGLSVPIIELLNRWVPQLVGRPQADGPLLQAFPPPQFRFLTKFFEEISRFLGNIRED